MDKSIFLPFSGFYEYTIATNDQIFDSKVQYFSFPQSGRIDQANHGFVFDIVDVTNEMSYFMEGQHIR